LWVSAKRICEYPDVAPSALASGAAGARIVVKCGPPSVVFRIDPHGGFSADGHGPAPSSHQVSSPIAVNDWGAKFAGGAGGGGAVAVVEVADVTGVDALVWSVLECLALAAVV
jgi:hypothetical protein